MAKKRAVSSDASVREKIAAHIVSITMLARIKTGAGLKNRKCKKKSLTPL